MARKSTGPRPYRSGINVQFGLLSFTVDLIAPTKTEAKGPRFTNACPDCYAADNEAEAVPVSLHYVCPDDHGPFEAGQLLKAVKADGELQVVGTKADVETTKSSSGMTEEELEKRKRSLPLTPHAATDVAGSTFVGEKSYVLRCANNDDAYRVFLNLVDENGLITTDDGQAILLGEVLLETKPKLVRLERWGDQLVLRELLRPDAVKEGLNINTDGTANEDYVSLARQLVGEMVEPFNPDEYADVTRRRMEEFVAARLDSPDAEVIQMPQPATGGGESNQFDALAAMLKGKGKQKSA